MQAVIAKATQTVQRWVDPAQIGRQIQAVQQAMRMNMIPDTHYGIIPGTKKKTLYKAGAEILCLMFRLRPEFRAEEVELPGGHLECKIVCELCQIPDGTLVGSGIGSCSTMESKYRYRTGGRKCPDCGAEGSIRKSKQEWGGGYYCAGNSGGCGSKFSAGDARIESQEIGKVENPDIADQRNTVRKMAKKRAFVDATLTATAASDIFTQDLKGDGEDGSQIIDVEAEDVFDEPPLTDTQRQLVERLSQNPAIPETWRTKITEQTQAGMTTAEASKWISAMQERIKPTAEYAGHEAH